MPKPKKPQSKAGRALRQVVNFVDEVSVNADTYKAQTRNPTADLFGMLFEGQAYRDRRNSEAFNYGFRKAIVDRRNRRVAARGITVSKATER